jgi:hypothetical protein
MAPPDGHKRPAAAPTQSARSASNAQLFAGCTMVFWAQAHTQIMRQRVQQLGGTIEPVLKPGSTTHVVCVATTSPKEAAAKLQGSVG